MDRDVFFFQYDADDHSGVFWQLNRFSLEMVTKVRMCDDDVDDADEKTD